MWDKIKANSQQMMWVGVGVLIVLAVFVAKEAVYAVIAALSYMFMGSRDDESEQARQTKQHKEAVRAMQAAEAARQAIAQKEKNSAAVISAAGKAEAAKVDAEMDAEFK